MKRINKKKIRIEWPDGKVSYNTEGEEWVKIASENGIDIPTGCLTGSCGACEIEINGEIYRACITCVSLSAGETQKMTFSYDPYW